jgi:hypothetical protein
MNFFPYKSLSLWHSVIATQKQIDTLSKLTPLKDRDHGLLCSLLHPWGFDIQISGEGRKEGRQGGKKRGRGDGVREKGRKETSQWPLRKDRLGKGTCPRPATCAFHIIANTALSTQWPFHNIT